MDDAKLTPEELEEMEKQFWEIVRKYRPEISEEKKRANCSVLLFF